LTEAAAEEGSKVNLEDKDTITAYLREKVRRLDNRCLLQLLMTEQVEDLIWRAKETWRGRQTEDTADSEMMLPLIRLKVSCHLPSVRSPTDMV
jgi:double-strand break repair protein MRE11